MRKSKLSNNKQY